MKLTLSSVALSLVLSLLLACRRAVALSTTPSPASKKVTLWTSGTCPFAQRAQIALEEAGVPYEVNLVDLAAKSDAFLDAYRRAVPGGRGKVPVLEVDGRVFAESMPIAELVCETWGDDALWPASPEARAVCKLMVEVQPFSTYLAVLQRADDPIDLADAISDLGRGVKDFDRFLETHDSTTAAKQDAPNDTSAGPFLRGADFTFAEAAVAPFVQRCAVALRHFVDVDLVEICALRGAPRARAFVEAVLARPSVAKTGVPDDKLIETTKLMLERFRDGKKQAAEAAARAYIEKHGPPPPRGPGAAASTPAAAR